MKNPFSKRVIANDAPSIKPDTPDSAERPMRDPSLETLAVDKPTAPPSAEMPMRPPVAETPANPPVAEAPAAPSNAEPPANTASGD